MINETSPKSSILRVIGEGIRKLFSIITLVCIVVVATMVILGNLFTDNLIQPQIWVDALEDARIADQSESLISKMIFSSYISMSTGIIGDVSQTSNWESIAKAIIPADWVKNNLKLIIQSTLEWLVTPDGKFPDLLIDLKAIKNNLRSPQGAVAALPLFENIPDCKGDVTKIVYLQGTLVSCVPVGWDLINVSGLTLNVIADTLPDQVSIVTLAASGNVDPLVFQSIYKVKSGYAVLEAGGKFGLQIVILLFCIYLLLQSKSYDYLINELPPPFYAVGIFLLLLFAGWYAIIHWGLRLLIPSMVGTLSLEIKSLLLDFVSAFGNQIQVKWLTWGFGLILVGIVLQVVSRILNKYTQRHLAIVEDKSRQEARVRKQFF